MRNATRVAIVAAGVIGVASGCGFEQAPIKIHNDTQSAVLVEGCAQEPGMRAVIDPARDFSFTDDVGRRVLSDDAGFACLLRTRRGLLCLHIPTDQSSRSTFFVRDARPTRSFDQCVATSAPHI